MNYLLTFSGGRYFRTTKRIVEDSPRFGVDRVLVVDDIWLRDCNPEHWEATRYFRERKDVRGVNWFCFKPYTIARIFERLEPDDVLLYVDADTHPIADLTPVYDLARKEGAVFFSARGCIMGTWTKGDVFRVMDCDSPEYKTPLQTVARFMAFHKGGVFPVDEFLAEWLACTMDPRVNTFDASTMGPEPDGYIQSRCEQSVLGVLTTKYGAKPLREACQFGGWGTSEVQPNERDVFGYRMFTQEGAHSFAPGVSRDESHGSTFRNVHD